MVIRKLRFLMLSCFVLLLSLLARDSQAQPGCSVVSNITIQAQYDSICPGEIDTIQVISSFNADTSIWFNLSESGWQSSIPSGTYGIDIASWKYHVYGLFDGSSTKVYEFNDNSWSSVTSSLPGGYDYQNLTLDPNTGVIYVSGKNSTTNYASVWKWTGSSWSTVGTSNFSSLPVANMDLEVYADTSVYLAFRESYIYGRPYVMKYNGFSWSVMDTILSLGNADIIDLEVSPTNVPYVAIYSDNLVYSMQLSSWNGTNWVVLGANTSTFQNGSCSNLDIEFNGSTLYYIWDNDLTKDIKLLQYSSGIWTNISHPSFGNARFPSIEFDHGQMVMSFHDEVTDTRPYFRRAGTSWNQYFVDQLSIPSYYVPKMVLGKYAFPNSLVNSDFRSYTSPYLTYGAGLNSLEASKTGIYALVGKDSCPDYRLSNLAFVESKILPTYDIDTQHVSCYGFDDATIELTSNPAGTILSYSWNTGDTTNLIDSLSPGEYIVGIQGHYCLIQDTFVITEPDPLILNLQGVAESCDNGKDGMILNLSTGGTKPYEVSISGVAIDTGNIKHLNNGTYGVWFTDANGCRDSSTATVGLTTAGSIPVLTNDTFRTLCYDSILLHASHVNPDKEWWNWNDLQSTYVSGLTNKLSGNEWFIFVDRDNQAIASRGRGVVRRQVGQSNTWQSVDHYYHYLTNWPNTRYDYLNGVFVNINFSPTVVRIRSLYDGQTAWKDYPMLIPSGGVNDVVLEHFRGYLYMLVAFDSIPSMLYRYDQREDDWLVMNNNVFPAGTQKVIAEVLGNQMLFSGQDQNGNLILKIGANNMLSTIDSGTNSCDDGAWDVSYQKSGEIFLSCYTYPSREIHLLSYKSGVWDTLATDYRGGNILKQIKIHNHPSGQIILSSSDGYRDYVDHYFRGEINQLHNYVLGYSDFHDGLAIYENGDMIILEVFSYIHYPKRESLSDSAYVSSTGLYQHVARNGDCYSYSKEVWVNPKLEIEAIKLNNVSCKDGSDGSAMVDITPETGTLPISLLWSNATTSDTLLGVPDSQYVITVTDNNNCVKRDTVFITEPDSLIIQSISTTAPACTGGNNGTAKAIVTGGTLPYLYTWPGQSLVETDSVLIPAQFFQLNLVDSNGCMDSATATVPAGVTSFSPLTIAGEDSALCTSDSILLTGMAPGPDYQWYDLTQGIWDTIGHESIDPIPSSSSDRYVSMDMCHDEFNNKYAVGLYNRSFLVGPDLIKAHLFNKVGWSQIGEVIGIVNEMPFLQIEALSVGNPVVVYVTRENNSDTLFIKAWNGSIWETLYSETGLFNKIDVKRNGSSTYLIYAKEGENLAHFGEITNLGFLPIQQFATSTQVKEVQLDNNDNGTLSILLLSQSAKNSLYDPSLYLYDGSFTSITLNTEFGWGQRSSAFITNNEEIYVINGRRFERQTINGWATLEEFGGSASFAPIYKVNNDGVAFRFVNGVYRIEQFNVKDGWKSINSPFGHDEWEFDPFGLPVIIRGNRGSITDPFAYQFVPDSIPGENLASYMAKAGDYVMLRAGSNDCYDQENALIKKANVAYDDYEYLYCPDDSSNVSAIPVDFNDSTTIIWNTGDTIYDLGLKQDGQYIFTITDGTCTVTDTILIEQVDDFQFSLDSVSDISCPGDFDGYAKVSASSAYTHYIMWSDIGYYNTTTERNDLIPGDYSVIMRTTSCGYYDTIPFTIADKAAIPASVVTSSTSFTVCDSMPVNLTCSSDTAYSVNWMSFDSLIPEEVEHTGLTYYTQYFTEVGNEMHAYREAPGTNETSIVKLKGKRWEEIWSDSTGYNVSSLFLDQSDNFMLSGQLGSNASRKTEILRLAPGDTSVFSTILHPNRNYYDINFEYVGGSLYYVAAAPDNFTSYRTMYFGKYNGSGWDSLSVPPVRIRLGYPIDFAKDQFGNFWIGVEEDQTNKYRLYKMTESGWTLELTYPQRVDAQSAIHVMPDGTVVFMARDKIASNLYNFSLFTYNGSTWDTISDRHPNMVNTSVYTVDVTNDPAGNLMIFYDYNLYTRMGNAWEITAQLPYPGAVLRFLERNCTYPMTTSNSKCFRMNPGTFVGSGNSISVSDPGIYTPVTESGGCNNYNACNVVVKPSLSISIELLSGINCNDDSIGSLGVNIETGGGPFTYSWSSGDTTASIDGLTAGWYTVTVSDQSACASTDSFELIEPQAIDIQLVQLTDNGCGNDTNGQISLSATGGTGTLNILWSTSDSTWTLSGLSSGNYTATITDSLGCISDSAFQIDAIDSLSPQLSTSTVILYLDSSGQASLSALQPDTFFTDNCGIDSIMLAKDTFNCTDAGPNKIAISAYDLSNNSTFDSLNVVVYDTILPVLQAYTRPVVMLDSNGSGVLSLSAVDSGSYDNCGLASLQLSAETFTCNEVGLQNIWLTSVDLNGNTDSVQVSIEVVDLILPRLAATPIDLYLDATGNATFNLLQMGVISSDNCGIDSVWAQDYIYTCADEGSNSNWVYAVDLNGNMDSMQLSFQILDSLRPIALPFAHYTVSLNAAGYELINANNLDSASYDNCSLTNVDVNIDSVTCANVGLMVASFKVTDQNGMADSVNLMLHIEDNLLPQVHTKSANIYLDNLGNALLTVADVNNGSNDNCGIQQMILSKDTFDCADIGSNQVWLIATDNNGNKDSLQASVNVIDTIKPTISALLNDTIYLDQNGQASVVASSFDLGSADNCGGLSFTLAQTDFFCSDLGSNSVSFTATDGASNSSSVTINIFVSDSINPVITCFGDTGICVGKSFIPEPVFSDNCSATLQQLAGPSNSTSLAVGTYTYTYKAEDSSGNSSTCSYVLTVAEYPDVDLGPDTAIHRGEQINLEVKAGYELYDWSTGSTGPQITATIISDTTFWVEVSNEFGCISRDTITISISYVDIEELLVNNETIKIYPNPTSSKIYLEFMEATPDGLEFDVLTVRGQLVEGIPVDRQFKRVSLDLTHQAPGMYWIRINWQEQTKNIPVIVK